MPDEQDAERLEKLRHTLESRRQLRQATANFEHAALKPLLLLNGGALIAFLAFLGTDPGSELNKDLAVWALFTWGFGLLAATIAVACGYLSQLAFYKAHGQNLYLQFDFSEYVSLAEVSKEKTENNYKTQSRRGNQLRRGAHIFGFLSLLAFAVGVYLASRGLLETVSGGA